MIKVEKYLRECVDSILNQTFTEFQVILVDDGSPDACGAICDDYAEKDNRVKVLHKINGGVSSARNSGVNQFIGGRYLTFVDSDDTIPPTAFADMWAEVENHPGVDVVCGQVELEGKAWMDFSGLPDFIDDRQYLSKHYFQSVLSQTSVRYDYPAGAGYEGQCAGDGGGRLFPQAAGAWR